MELALLPDLVLIKILKLLQSNLEDVNNLKNVNTTFRKIVTDNFHLLYYEHLCIDNKAINFSIKLGRPILKLTMTCYAEALTMPKYNIDPGSVDPLNTFPMELINHPSSPTAWLESILPRLNFNMMTELEIRCTDRHALNRYLDLRDILMRQT